MKNLHKVMTDYIVVKEDTLELLVERVNENIVEGYTTVGSVSCVKDGATHYIQAMCMLLY